MDNVLIPGFADSHNGRVVDLIDFLKKYLKPQF
jgi:hypothetical protein